MRLVFAGTPEFAVPTLQSLLDSNHEVVAVYTQPDRPAGRGRKLTSSPVKQLAQEHSVPVVQPLTLKDEQPVIELEKLKPDLMVVVAYGLILPEAVLSVPSYGCLNVHASLLPRWRGAAPIQRAILAGDEQSGVTIMQMDVGLDTGDMLLRETIGISPDMTASELHDELASLGAKALVTVVDAIGRGQPPVAVRQTEADATYAAKLSKQEAEIDWEMSAVDITRQIKAFNPWPVAYTHQSGKLLRIWDAKFREESHSGTPGTFTGLDNGLPVIACGQGSLILLEVQAEGKKRMSAQDYMNARKGVITPGVMFGQ